MVAAMVFILNRPKYTTAVVLMIRTLISAMILYLNYMRFHDKKVSHESTDFQLSYYRGIYDIKTTITTFYIELSILMTPFCEKYFVTFVVSSMIFCAEYVQITKYFDLPYTFSVIYVPTWVTLMFLSSYFIRRVLTEFFVLQTQAEKTREALTLILDNMPDGVLMLE